MLPSYIFFCLPLSPLILFHTQKIQMRASFPAPCEGRNARLAWKSSAIGDVRTFIVGVRPFIVDERTSIDGGGTFSRRACNLSYRARREIFSTTGRKFHGKSLHLQQNMTKRDAREV